MPKTSPVLARLTWMLAIASVSLLTFTADNASAQSEQTSAGKLNHNELAKFIDQKVNARLQQNKMDVSGGCTDAEFIRRVYLDILGAIPPAEKVAAFLDSTDTNKRAKLIDELLDNPQYGKRFAEIWSNAVIPSDSNVRRLSGEYLENWLAERLNKNVGWDEIVRDIVTAKGEYTEKNGATTFFIANPAPDKLTDKATQLFLGVQLQCAQCHDHPFTEYKQEEYWAMAAFFMQTRISGNPNQAAKKGRSIIITEADAGKKARKLRLPPEAKIVPAKFLSGPKAEVAKNKPYRPVLAEWMTSKENKYFARAISNKLWYHFFGRGLVNPVDDMHDDNPASHPELLAGLAEQMKANDFDLKYLIRAICNSESYQRSSRPTGNNVDDQELFSRALVRNMTPEQLYDSYETVLQQDKARAAALKKAKRKTKNNRNAVTFRSRFVDSFGKDVIFNPLEYQAGIPQALQMMNSRLLGNSNYLIVNVMKSSKTPEDAIEQIFLSTVSRRPTEAELTRLSKYVADQSNPRNAYGDVIWALLNSSEFSTNH